MNSKRWVKLFQKLLVNPVFKDSELLHLFIFCLLKANYKPDQWICGNQVIPLKVGQFATGIKTIVKETNIKQTTIYRKMKVLTDLGIISIKAENKFSVITVNKYSSYQVEGKQTENKRKTRGKQTDTVLEDIEDIEDIEANVYVLNQPKKQLFANSPVSDFETFKTQFEQNPNYANYDSQHYYNAVKNWSSAKVEYSADWIATAYMFVTNDVQRNKAVKKKELTRAEIAKLAAEGKLA